jgi:uncharacterized coiled-coil DUF342 family protein
MRSSSICRDIPYEPWPYPAQCSHALTINPYRISKILKKNNTIIKDLIEIIKEIDGILKEINDIIRKTNEVHKGIDGILMQIDEIHKEIDEIL